MKVVKTYHMVDGSINSKASKTTIQKDNVNIVHVSFSYNVNMI